MAAITANKPLQLVAWIAPFATVNEGYLVRCVSPHARLTLPLFVGPKPALSFTVSCCLNPFAHGNHPDPSLTTAQLRHTKSELVTFAAHRLK